MKTIILVLIAVYSIFVLVIGTLAQKGMMLAVLVLCGLLLLFHRYSLLTRNLMRRYNELKRAVFTADSVTNFIELLESKGADNQTPDPGIEVNRAVRILKTAKMRAAYSGRNEPNDEALDEKEKSD